MEVGKLWATLGLKKSAYDEGLNEAKSQGSGLVGFLKNAFQFTVGQGMFDLLKTGIKSAWDSSIGFNSTMQQNTIAFETMLGSADKAGKLLGELSNLAAATPFEFPELANAAKSLTAFGIDSTQVADKLRRIGDIASGVGVPVGDLSEIFGKAKVQGRLFAEDINQLTGRGIPIIQEFAKQFGVTESEVKKLVEQGKIGFPQLDQAFNSLTDKGGKFAGMMEAQSKSFSGMMSTLKDNVNMTLANIMKPQFEWLNSVALPKALDFVNQLSVAFTNGGMKGVLSEIFPSSIVGVLTGIGNGIQASFGWLSQNGSTVTGILSAIVGAFIAYKTAVIASTVAQEAHNAVSAIMTILKGKEAIAEALSTTAKSGSTVAQWLLNAAMTANPLGIVIVAIGALVGALIYLWNTNEGFRKAIIGTWEAIKKAAVSVWDFIIELFKRVLDFFMTLPQKLYNYGSDMFTSMKNGVQNTIGDVKESIVNGITQAINWIKNLPGEALTWGKDMIEGFVKGIKDRIKNVVGAVEEIGNSIRSFLHFSTPDEGPLADYETWMPDFIDGMTKGIKSNKDKLTNAVQEMALGMDVNGRMNIEGKAEKARGSSGDVLNFEKLFEGAIFNIRSDEDIKKIARIIYDMIVSRGRGLGVSNA